MPEWRALTNETARPAPNAMKDDSELAGERNARLAGAGSAGENASAQSLRLDRRFTRVENDHRRFKHKRSGQAIAAP